jgi:nucleotide-binding universal stress UspA family protein
MKTVIIPVDFSETSLNAARYAAGMLSGKQDTHIILFNLYEHDDEYETAGNYLNSLKAELEWKGDKDIECMREKGADLIDSLERLAYQKSATLIVMGITGKAGLKKALVGSNTLKIAERDVCPVLIIPPDAKFNGIKNVALASEMKDVETATPALHINNVLELFNARLHIVNVDSTLHVALTEEKKEEKKKMQKLFKKFNPEFYFIGTSDFTDTIEQFAADQAIDMIITVPHYHNFYGKVFGGSNTKKLAYHSTVPVMAAYP